MKICTLKMADSLKILLSMQQGFHKHTRVRDYAMLSLFLGTGIRISELVGLDNDSFDFEEKSFLVGYKKP